MALNREVAEKLLNRLDSLQKEIEAIHNELLLEINNDKLSTKEILEIEAVRKENDYRVLEEWQKEELPE